MTRDIGDGEAPYLLIAVDLRSRIDSGEFAATGRLPSVEVLRVEYGYSKATIEHAVRVLRDEGRVVTRHGVGTFLREPQPREPTIAEVVARLESLERWREDVEGGPPDPEPQPVAVAIVTSGQAVLVTKRRDGNPPYGFPAGEVEPGEDAAHAAVREVKEECALEVRARREIGRRVHPRTGRTMIYIACRVHQVHPEVINGDEDELEGVMWHGLQYVLALMPDIYEPVADYLRETLKVS